VNWSPLRGISPASSTRQDTTRARTCSTGLGELGCPDELNDLILGHVKRGVLAHYDHSKRIPERAELLRRWADHVAECVGLTEPTAANAEPRLHLYETREGLPELKAVKEPANGRRYLGAFTAAEAARRIEGMARRSAQPTRAPSRPTRR